VLRATLPPSKGKRKAGALGRHRGSKSKTNDKSPRRPAKDRLKEPHDGVLPGKHAPIPKQKGKKPDAYSKNSRPVSVPVRSARSRLCQDIDRRINVLIDGSQPLNKGSPKEKKPRTRIKYQKWDLSAESWNFLRGSRLKRLRKSLNQVIEGRNPFYKFKGIFNNVKIHNLGYYNRLTAILDNGYVLSGRPIGIGIVPPIRRVWKLSFREVEFLISKLPFWATSYKYSKIYKLAMVISYNQPVREPRSF
jgi:hypothetical protein